MGSYNIYTRCGDDGMDRDEISFSLFENTGIISNIKEWHNELVYCLCEGDNSYEDKNYLSASKKFCWVYIAERLVDFLNDDLIYSRWIRINTNCPICEDTGETEDGKKCSNCMEHLKITEIKYTSKDIEKLLKELRKIMVKPNKEWDFLYTGNERWEKHMDNMINHLEKRCILNEPSEYTMNEKLF